MNGETFNLTVFANLQFLFLDIWYWLISLIRRTWLCLKSSVNWIRRTVSPLYTCKCVFLPSKDFTIIFIGLLSSQTILPKFCPAWILRGFAYFSTLKETVASNKGSPGRPQIPSQILVKENSVLWNETWKRIIETTEIVFFFHVSVCPVFVD